MEYTEIKEYLKVSFKGIQTYLCIVSVKDILPIYYVAVRGRDSTEGAVQRILNRRRIASIRDFILEGNMFFNTFILNWTDKNYSVKEVDGVLKIPIINGAAQVIDGQHRLEGLKIASEMNESIGEEKLIIVFAENLSTKEAANIFLNINTEQKPVPKSLVYDLFGEIKDKTSNIVRATDIASDLHNDKESPYYQSIKLPGAAQGVGKIDLSTIVSSLKPYFEENSVFFQYHLREYSFQYKIISNFFLAIQDFYSKEGIWLKAKNPFMTNAGFFASIRFLCDDLIPKCVEKKSFEKVTFMKLLRLDESGLLYRDDIKNMQGKEQRNEIYRYLKSSLLKEIPKQDEYKF